MARRLSIRVGLWALIASAACTTGGDTREEARGSTSTDTQAAQSSPPTADAIIAAAQTESFQRFWAAFRQAILAGDMDKIAAVTRFPFETRGPSDDDPVRRHDRAAFPSLLGALLAEESGSASGGTTRELIERTTTLTERNFQPGDKEARVGRFSFENAAGRWWFTRAYRND